MALRRAPSNVKSFLVSTKYAKPAMRREYMKTKVNGSTASQFHSHQINLTNIPQTTARIKRVAQSKKLVALSAINSNSNLCFSN